MQAAARNRGGVWREGRRAAGNGSGRRCAGQRPGGGTQLRGQQNPEDGAKLMQSLLGNKYLWSLTLGHFTIDLYSGAMPVVLLYLTTTLHLSLEQVGLVSAVYSICSSISQPLFGYVADRFGGKWLASGGLLWMSVLQGVVGFVPNFTTLMIVAP